MSELMKQAKKIFKEQGEEGLEKFIASLSYEDAHKLTEEAWSEIIDRDIAGVIGEITEVISHEEDSLFKGFSIN